MKAVPLAELFRCFQGVAPSLVATCDTDGVPNLTYVSHVYLVDERHVALSRQFFNKTTRNLAANPRAMAEVYDPVTFQAFRLRLRHLRTETRGPLFDLMCRRLDAIASHTGMTGVFRLLGADVFEVLEAVEVEGFLAGSAGCDEVVSAAGRRTELRGLQCVSEAINRAADLESLLEAVLEALEAFFGFRNTLVLLLEEGGERLVTLASRGYGPRGIGAEVAVGEGLIGAVARDRRLLRVSGLDQGLAYGRAARRELEAAGQGGFADEVPLPGLADARSALVIPLAVRGRLLGVLAAESRDPIAFDEWHEAYLEVVGYQIALALERTLERPEEPAEAAVPGPAADEGELAGRPLTVTFHAADESVFVDGEYLIRNLPARILWKVLGEHARGGKREWSNRELRLDRALGLPELRDNLESRLILLRRRLEERCPDLALVPTRRGHFALRLRRPFVLDRRP
jgi:adenylate cyclase